MTVAVALRNYPDDYLIAVTDVHDWIIVVMQMAQGDCASSAGGGLLMHQSDPYVGDSVFFEFSDIPVRSSLRDIHPLHRGPRGLRYLRIEGDGSGRCFG